MKKLNTLILGAALAMGTGTSLAQSLFKDLYAGAHPLSSNPLDYYNVDGTMYIITRATNGSSLANYQLWKSDGTVAGTTLLKDSLYINNTSDNVKFCTNVNSTLFFMVTPVSSTTPQLWKTDGTTAGTVQVTTLPYTTGSGGGAPGGFVAFDNKLYFHFGQSHGRELWVSDGTAAGTMEVLDLAPGTVASVQLSGLADTKMIVFNNKIYFAGTTGLADYEVFASDGTAAGTALAHDINPGVSSADPDEWFIYNNELYFNASNGSVTNLWKTDGTTATQLTTGINASRFVIFKNEVYFAGGIDLWKTNGTVAGTTFITDSVINVRFMGANDDYLFSFYQKYIPTPPYYEQYFYRTDGTAAGTVPASYDLANSASFDVVDNQMYITRLDSGSFTSVGIWRTDGTEAGTSKIFNGYGTGYVHIFNDTVFFANFESATGYELWYLDVSGPTDVNENEMAAQHSAVYPNPSAGIFRIKSESQALQYEVYNATGTKVRSRQDGNRVDISNEPRGLYFLNIFDNGKTWTEKIVLR